MCKCVVCVHCGRRRGGKRLPLVVWEVPSVKVYMVGSASRCLQPWNINHFLFPGLGRLLFLPPPPLQREREERHGKYGEITSWGLCILSSFLFVILLRRVVMGSE